MLSSAAVAQLVEQLLLNLEDVGLTPILDKIFPHACAYFGTHSRCGIILPRLRLRGQLQNRTALNLVKWAIISVKEKYVFFY